MWGGGARVRLPFTDSIWGMLTGMFRTAQTSFQIYIYIMQGRLCNVLMIAKEHWKLTQPPCTALEFSLKNFWANTVDVIFSRFLTTEPLL